MAATGINIDRLPQDGARDNTGPMKPIWLIVATLGASVWIGSNQMSAAETVVIDLTQWTPPDISKVGEDPFGELVKYGHALLTDTTHEIRHDVSYSTNRLC